MTEPGAPTTTTRTAPSDPAGPVPTVPGRTGIRLVEYLALREVPWSLAYVGFLVFVVVTTTYVLNIGTAAMAIAWFGLILGRRRIQWPLQFWLLLLFWIWAALSAAGSQFSGDMQPVIDLGKIILVFLMAVNVLWHPLAFRNFLLLFVSCFVLFPVRGTLSNYYIHNYADFGRPHWIQLFGNPNDLAALTILALAIAASFLHREAPRLVRLGALLACLVMPFIVLLTQSRAAFLGLSVFLLLVAWKAGRNRIRMLMGLTIIAAIVIAVAPTDVWDRIAGLRYAESTESIDRIDPEGSAIQRWEIWQTGLRIIGDHPVLGVGLGRYEQANLAYSPKLGARDIHDTYLEVLAETGFPGLILFLLALITILLRAARVRRRAGTLRESAEWRRLQFLEFGMYGYLTAGIWGTYGFLSMLYIYLAILIAQTEILAGLAAKPSAGLGTPAFSGART